MAAFAPEHLLLVAVDLCRMLGNRLDSRLDNIQVRQRAAAKIVVDPVPYLARPWQVYFPYSLLNRTLLGYNHSYAIEGEYKKFKEGLRETNPCAAETIAPRVAPVTFIDYRHYFDQPVEVCLEAVSARVRAEYESYKRKLFAEEKGIASLISKLDKFVQGWVPQRRLPLDLKKIYQPEFRRVVRTDLPLDDYLYGEIKNVIEHTNCLTERLYAAHV